MGKLTLILGGARSGKSVFAEQLAAQQAEPVLYIATAQALDTEMQARILAHKDKRPKGWKTLETPCQVGKTILEQPFESGLILLDCLTLLVSNLVLDAGGREDEPDEILASAAVEAEIDSLLAAIRKGAANWIVVSNEVGMGLVPPYPLGRVYRDLLGKANMRLAQSASEVYLMVAGIPVPIHPHRISPP